MQEAALQQPQVWEIHATLCQELSTEIAFGEAPQIARWIFLACKHNHNILENL